MRSVMELVKDLVVESQFGGPIRRYSSLQLADRDAVATKLAATQEGTQALDTRNFRKFSGQKSSTTLFILGSGESILDLNDSHFEVMNSHTSIGVNSWVIHPFIPDIYAFESLESAEHLNEALVLKKTLERRSAEGNRPVIMHLRPHAHTPRDLQVLPPSEMKDKFFFYGRTTLGTKKMENLEGDLTFLIESHSRGRLPKEVLLDSGGSVGRMVSWGIFAGFKNIVLVGVDLGHNQYFFDGDPRFLKDLGIKGYNPWKNRSLEHETQQRLNRPFIATEFLGALATVSQKLGGPQIFVGAEKSLLAETMPVFDWTLRA